nr:potassium transporter KefB [Pyrinomonadaceae bacterium]
MAFICVRLKLPVLVGFMLTGILIGPFGLGLIKELEAIELLAEIGVMLLLFTIGIEFSLKRLATMKTLVIVGGGLQVFLTIGITALIATGFGRSFGQSIYFGFLVALSSTAIVLKTYADRREIDSPHGRAGVGILLFQDISIVFMMLAIPLLVGTDSNSPTDVAIKLGSSLLALVMIVLAARFLIPNILELVVNLRSPEVLLLAAALISFGTAWISQQFGLSLALGAFIAGVILSESEYSYQINAEILPFRDIFNSIFFVSIGLLLSVSSLIENLPTVLFWVGSLIILKILIVWATVKVIGYPHRIAAMTALGLAQIGEFSFVLAKAGKGTALLPEVDYQVFLAASIISMFVTPFLIAIAPRFGDLLQKLFSDGSKEFGDETEEIHVTASGELINHVIIAGYGLAGRSLARVLNTVHVPYTILELNAEVIRRAKKKGEKINFGDVTRQEILKHVRIEDANALVLAISDPQAQRTAVQQARKLSEDIYIIVRTRFEADIAELVALGANHVVTEEFETSIEIFSLVLHKYGVASNVIQKQISRVRRGAYQILRSPSLPADTGISDLDSALSAAATDTVRIRKNSPVVGQTLAELDIRGKTGVSIIAVIQNGETIVSPGGDFELKRNDVLALLGESEKVDVAIKILRPPKKKKVRIKPE